MAVEPLTDAAVSRGDWRRARDLVSSHGRLQEQAIGFLPHRGRRVAYAVAGSGPLLLMDVGRAHHLEAFWRHAPYRQLVRRLALRFTVVRWDRPGFGLSDRAGMDLSPEAELALVGRLVEFLGGDRVAIFAAGDSGPGMVRFAARHPEHVSRLALFGTGADGRDLVPSLPGEALELLSIAPPPAIHEVLAASLAAGCRPEVGAWLAPVLEASASAAAVTRLLGAGARDQAGVEAGLVRAPTLVLHRAGDTVVPFALGRALAGRIPGAAFAALEGRSHLPYAGDPGGLLAVLVPFLTRGRENEPVALTPRELEVAHMVTLGITNADIGRRLSIRRRTVDAHLEHIRSKLGVGTRTRIAAWAVRDAASRGA